MIDFDKQIDLAKRKPLTAENLNYIGDLYLKKNDKQRAVAYFFEACDKLHFAQKEKKIAIYKKILKISPLAERAYIDIIEILSKMGLVMEEKKFLHMLAQLYENRGDAAKAAELFARINDLDPHVSPGGTFFHPETHREVMDTGDDRKELRAPKNETEKDNVLGSPGSISGADDAVSAEDLRTGKLIEATLEEIFPEETYPSTGPSKWRLQRRYLLGGAIVLFLLGGVIFFFHGGNRGRSVPLLPLSTRVNDFDVTLSRLDDLSELAGIIAKQDLDKSDFFVLTLNSRQDCIPDAFATYPHNMISLLARKGGTMRMNLVEGLQKTTRTISKMNICGRDNAVVFIKTIVAVDRQGDYSGLTISGLQTTGQLTIRWDSR